MESVLRSKCLRPGRHGRCLMWAVVALAGIFSVQTSFANDDVANAPLFLTPTVSPLVMLTMSNDHQLYFEAYPEYADLNDDGEINQTYTPEVNYYGYFDSAKCYDYDTTNSRFTPQGITTDGYCDGVDGSWSGNFLNWVSMSRIDVVRQILFGGYRSTDTEALTILERSYLPSDAHAWARFYNGDDIAKLTPFSDSELNDTVVAQSTSTEEIGKGNRSFTTSGPGALTSGTRLQRGDQIEIRALDESNNVVGIMKGVATNSHGSSGNITVAVSRVEKGEGTTHSKWELENHSRAGISFCNVTYASEGVSQDITAPPLIRVAQGNYALWDANERFQCRWLEEESDGNRINFNDIGVTTLAANNRNPHQGTVGLGEENYVARVEVCDGSLIGDEDCKQYPNGNYKPIGLIQEYGDNESIYFGLLTGSNVKNKSGGVLRKNIASSADEVNVATDGTFKVPDASVGSIIDTLNRFRMYGYDHDTGHYNDTDDCIWGLSSFNDGQCTGWGNPQSEIVLEAIRYFANAPIENSEDSTLAPTPDFTFDGKDRIEGLGHVDWEPPINNENFCAAPTHVNFNSSVASYDAETLGSASDLPGIDSVTANPNVTTNPNSVYGWTNRVGEGEGLHGEPWFIGRNGTDNNDLCTSKILGSLAEARGLCPESPRLGGSYLAAGLAHYAYTQDLRPDLSSAQYGEQRLKTYAVAMAPAVPQINIPRPGETEPSVRLLPACYNTATGGNCAIVDFKVIEQTRSSDRNTGSFLVNWEDSEQGGDYDMDMIGILSYEITSSDITVTTRTTADTSDDPMGFGYILSGTNTDGFHVTSGINDFTFTVDGGSNNGCSGCDLLDDPVDNKYALRSGGMGDLLESPMYYAAKWGGYDRSLNFPDDPQSWDRNGNGMPDNYYFAIDPARLAEDLRTVFADIIATSNPSAAVATNSSRLDEDTAIFQAMFDSGNWFGDLLSFDFTTEDQSWSAAEQLRNLNSPYNSRNILTTFGGLASELQNTTPPALDFGPSGEADGFLSERIEWLYGRDPTGVDFRSRTVDGQRELLGDIVNSDPVFVGKPNYGYDSLPGTEGGSYLAHRVDIQSRRDMVYVGANDGMLHGFDARTGDEVMAYMPGELLEPEPGEDFAPVSRLMDPDYDHRYYVDGTATVRAAYIDGEWKTILVGTMGAGGRTVFALDVTDPDVFDGFNAQDNVLWEFTHDELGLGVTEPEIVRLPGGDWVAVFGNGYGGTSGKSGVFVVSLGYSGNDSEFHFLSTDEGLTTDRNAMAPPFITDWTGRDDNAIRRTANLGYVGDLHGNLWRMNFGSGIGDLSLDSFYTATYTTDDGELQRQPITSKPVGQPDPANREQYIVSFGTGSFFLNSDRGNDNVQSLYGLIDDFDGAITAALLEQAIIWQGSHAATDEDGQDIVYRELRATSDTEMDGQPGWRLNLHYRGEGGTGNLPPQGERVVARPSLAPGINRPAVRYTTLIPDTGPCGFGRTGFLMELSIASGSRPASPVFDLDGDGQFGDGDLVPVMIDGEEVQVPISGVGGVTQGEELSTVVDEFGVEQIVQPVDPDGGESEPSPGLLGDGASTGRQAWEQLR